MPLKKISKSGKLQSKAGVGKKLRTAPKIKSKTKIEAISKAVPRVVEPVRYNTRSHDKKSLSTPIIRPSNVSKRNRKQEVEDVDGAYDPTLRWRASEASILPRTTTSGSSKYATPSALFPGLRSDGKSDKSSQTVPQKSVFTHNYEQRRFITNDKSIFEPGLVISTPWHEPDHNAWKRTNFDSRSIDTDFGPVYSKGRKFIIIAVYTDHCITIPIFSFNGQGIERKTGRTEFVKIKDLGLKDSEPSANDIPALHFQRSTAWKHHVNGFHVMSAASHAHITYPASFKYASPSCIEGTIEHTSLVQLVNLFKEWLPRFEPPRAKEAK